MRIKPKLSVVAVLCAWPRPKLDRAPDSLWACLMIAHGLERFVMPRDLDQKIALADRYQQGGAK